MSGENPDASSHPTGLPQPRGERQIWRCPLVPPSPPRRTSALAKTGLTWDDIQWFVPHQANLRINEKVVEVASIPRDKVLNSIQFYGNTTAATVPLTIDHLRREGRVRRGDRILSSVFGSRLRLGAAIFTL